MVFPCIAVLRYKILGGFSAAKNLAANRVSCKFSEAKNSAATARVSSWNAKFISFRCQNQHGCVTAGFFTSFDLHTINHLTEIALEINCWFHKRMHCTHCIVITRHHNRASSLRQTVISCRHRLKWVEIYAALVNTWAGSQVYAIHVLSNLQAASSCNIEIACSLFSWIFGEKYKVISVLSNFLFTCLKATMLFNCEKLH